MNKEKIKEILEKVVELGNPDGKQTNFDIDQALKELERECVVGEEER